MILFILLVVLLLLIGWALFVLPASSLVYRHEPRTTQYPRLSKPPRRTGHEEREGVVSERALHIEDLQRAMMADIPAAAEPTRRLLPN